MTADELRELQRQAREDRKQAQLSTAALRAGVLAARAEGQTQRAIAQVLGVAYSRVQAIERPRSRKTRA